MNEAPKFQPAQSPSEASRPRAAVDDANPPHGDASPLDSTAEQDALRSLLRAHGIFRRVFDPHLARFGLTGCQWGVLRALARHEARGMPPMRMNELGAATFVQPPSMSATLTRMERQGLIERHPDPTDSRSRLVLLTPKAREAMARVLTVHGAWIDRVTSGLTSTECEKLHELLTRLADHIETVDVVRLSEDSTADTDAEGTEGEAGCEGCEPPSAPHA